MKTIHVCYYLEVAGEFEEIAKIVPAFFGARETSAKQCSVVWYLHIIWTSSTGTPTRHQHIPYNQEKRSGRVTNQRR